jgi:hypothetical protein
MTARSRAQLSPSASPLREPTPPLRHQRGDSPSESPSSESEPAPDRPCGARIEDARQMIEQSITSVFAAHDQTLTTGTGTGTIPPSFPSLTSPSTIPQHVLSHWLWVPEDVVKSIAAGNFDIDNLPKLHRSDELRNAYLKRSMKGGAIYNPLDGRPAEFIVGTSKLQSSFRDSTTFFLAWHIYTSIRSEFKPEMGSRLAFWTETVQYFVHLNYSWPVILSYIIAYYQTYQDCVDDQAWFQSDPTLMQYHLTLVQQQKMVSAANTAAPRTPQGRRSQLSDAKLDVMSNEICQNFNRIGGFTWKDNHSGAKCSRRHDCIGCLASTHNALNCPRKKPHT